MSVLSGVSLRLVDSLDEALALKTWLGERREILAVDTESGGLNAWRDELRLVQLGDMGAGWAIPWPLWGGLAQEVLGAYEEDIVLHNLPHDVKFLRIRGGISFPWNRLHDTLILAALDDPMRPRGLKPLAKRLVDPSADAGEQALSAGMKANKWTWATVPYNYAPYWVYSAADPVLTAWLYHHLAPRVAADCPDAYDMERGINRVCTAMMMKGIRIDREYIAQAAAKLDDYYKNSVAWLAEAHKIGSPYSARDIGAALAENGEELIILSKSGLPQTDKEYLTRVRDYGRTDASRMIAAQVMGARHAAKMKSAYLENFIETADEQDIIRCHIWQAQAVTGRMCLPDSHRLLTQRGVLRVDDVRAGDLTLDASGSWTAVRAVHRYPRTETVVYINDDIRLEATAEHRWVTSLEGRPDTRRIEAIGSARRNLHLTPSAPDFDFYSAEIPLDGTDSVQFAALVGWLVSDGRSAEQGYGHGLHSQVYQTEQKFYKECLRCIPSEALSYDRITNGRDHHEMGVRARWLRPRLEAAGLAADPLLRTSATLLPWAMSLSMTELRAFFAAVWLADGSTSHPVNKHISCGSPQLRETLQYAGYRLGLRSRVTVSKAGGWSTGERYGVRFMVRGVTTRYLKRTPGRADVWCVTTDSGTFTAWDAGPYLTGNSITEPALQTLSRDDTFIRGSFIPREGHVFISCDYAQIEARLCAHYAEDPGMIEAFEIADAGGPDFFATIASQIFQRAISKYDPERQLTKNVVYGAVFGAGVGKMAQTAGVTPEVMRPVKQAFDARFPGLQRFSREAVRQARGEAAANGRPAVRSGMGRYLPVEPGKEYVAVNRQIQAEAAEVLKLAMLDLEAAGLGDAMLIPIHDEVLFEVPQSEAQDVRKLIEDTMEVRGKYRVPLTASAQILPERWSKK